MRFRGEAGCSDVCGGLLSRVPEMEGLATVVWCRDQGTDLCSCLDFSDWCS